jgi:MFS transporter, CP family, cyanate transporter
VSQGIVLTAVVLVALNLRAALSSLPTVATDIQAATGWNDSTLGILTTIPVLCMGVTALAVPSLAMHFGYKRLVVIALSSLTIAMLLRAIESFPWLLFVSAFLAGLGIALSGGLIPGIVRAQMPTSLGKASSFWTTAMMASAALGGALTVPLALLLDSWSLALAFWGLPAIVALIFWIYAERNTPQHDRPQTLVTLKQLPWRHPLAWALALNMAINSVVFYSSIAWIAPSYVERGWDQETAGWLFGAFTMSQVFAALILAWLASRIKYRRVLFAISFVTTAMSLLAIAWVPEFLPWLVLTIFGFSLSGAFAMMLTLLSEYSRDAPSAARLTAMVFFITYCIGALGPFLAGLMLDQFQSWSILFTILASIALLQLIAVPPLRRNIFVP